jgi:ribosomal protein S18 acetylase RimI-like enzyme
MIRCTAISLSAVRKLEPIPSSFETDRVFRLHRCPEGDGMAWRMVEEQLYQPFRKTYDSGRPAEWMSSYEDAARPEEMQFVAASADGAVQGLLTWRELTWNNTLWLLDIRTRPAARRTGVGSALMDHLKEVARKRTVRGIVVETQINNYPAICFYRKHGFQVAGFNDHLYTNHDLDRQDVALFLFWQTE